MPGDHSLYLHALDPEICPECGRCIRVGDELHMTPQLTGHRPDLCWLCGQVIRKLKKIALGVEDP